MGTAEPESFGNKSEIAAEVLIVEDSPADLRLLSQVLGQAGFSVRIAQTGQIALQSVALKQPDLILLDITLPDASGYEICAQLQSETTSAEIPIIFLSGLVQVTDKVKAFEYGGTDYVTKPYQAEELLARIHCHLNHRRTQQLLHRQNQQLRQQEEIIRANLHQEKTVAHITNQIHRSLDADKIFAVTVNLLRQALECDRVLIYRLNLDWKGTIVAEALNQAAPSAQAIWPQLTTAAPTQSSAILQSIVNEFACELASKADSDSFKIGRGRSVEDIHQVTLGPEYRQFLEQLQVRAYQSVPIYSGNGLWGILTACQHYTQRQWQKTDIAILTETSFQLGVALEQVALFTQVQQKSNELEQAQGAIEGANRAKNAFLANMSHELRTPLNAILGYTQLMSRDSALPPIHQDQLQVILDSGKQLMSLINNVLDFARLETGYLELHPEKFALIDLIQSVTRLVDSQIKQKGIQLKLALAPQLPGRVEVDLGKLKQVLLNLVTYAVKLAPPGLMALRVWYTPMDGEPINGDRFLLSFAVAATCADGFSSAPQDSFDTFTPQSLPLPETGGAEIGLAMSQRLIEFLGGQLTLKTPDSQASTAQINYFEFAIPVRGVRSPASAPQSTLQITGLETGPTRYRVLVVDDTYINRRLMTRLLPPPQFEVAEAENGEAAVMAWKTLKPQLILMDMRMPVLDGYGATRSIRQIEADGPSDSRSDPTKIIAITALSSLAEHQAAIAAGCDAVLTKPIQAEQLFMQIGRLLNIAYQQAVIPASAPLKPAPEMPLTAADFEMVPPEWLPRVYQAAQRCDDKQIYDYLEQLSDECLPLKRVLYRYTEELRLAQLLQVIEPYVLADRPS